MLRNMYANTKVNTNIRIKKNDMKVFAHYMGKEKDWNLSEDRFHEEGFRTRTVV